MPDARWGEAPHAFVVLRPGMTATPDGLRAFTRDRLAHFKAPHGHVRRRAAENGDRKIQKFILRGGRTAIVAQ